VAALAGARTAVLARISAVCQSVGRDPTDVDLVAVSKGMALPRVAAAVAAGFTLLGENRVQELAAKAPALPGATWHLIGHLQGNKARAAVELCAAVESVDSLGLAERLDRLSGELRGSKGPLPVYLQVNVDADPAKSGFSPAELERDLPTIGALAGLRIEGLMTVGRLTERPEEARATFVALHGLSDRLRSTEPRLGPGLSMGMSADFEVAIQEGATLVRVGQAIFGPRPQSPG
jgi:PLP dependent protein